MLELIIVSAALAAKPPPALEIVVADPTGAPIVGGAVVVPIEDQRHRVADATGAWRTETIYAKGSGAVKLQKGTSVEFWATAPGYVGQRITHVIAANPKKDRVVVRLDRMDPPSLGCWAVPPEPGNGVAIAESARVTLMNVSDEARKCPLQARAWGLALDVIKLEAEYGANPNDGLRAKIFDARKVAAEAVAEWRAYLVYDGNPADALPLCVMLTGSDKTCAGT